MAWNFKKYGTATDPVHKSDLNAITGEYGCDRRFKFTKDARAAGEDLERTSGKAAAGNAGHETLARALSTEELRERLCSGTYQVSRKQIDEVFREELDKETATIDVNWGKDSPDKIIAERVSMVLGTLNNLHKHAQRVLFVEPGFIVEIDGFWLSGHVDIIFEPRGAMEGTVALADWKTGAQKPHPIELDHGWESGIYSLAIERGLFIDRAEIDTTQLTKGDGDGSDAGKWAATCRGVTRIDVSQHQAKRRAIEAAMIEIAKKVAEAKERASYPVLERTFGTFPASIWHVHLGDYVPYQKSGKKEVKRREDIAHFGVPAGTTITYSAGELRGPAWLPVRRTEHDIPRLASMLRNVIGSARMGRFVERLGEKCERCAFKEECLNAGYEVRGDEKKQLERALRVLPPDVGDMFGDL